jgi:tetratricopeptide (TPR) repeat protein
MESAKRKSPSAGWHWTLVLIAALLWPAVALGAGASEVFQKVKDAIVVVKALDREGQEVSQGSGVVLPSGQVTIKNLAVPSEWQGELVAQSKKAGPPPGAKAPERAQAPGLSIEPGRAESERTWSSQAAALEAAKDWSGLLEHSKRWTRAEPGESLAWYALGIAYRKLGRYQEAVDAYKEALRLKPDDAAAWYSLGNAYWDQGRYQEAIQAYKEALRLKPDDAAAWYNLGNAYSDQGRYQEAIQAYKEALRLEPDDAAAWNNLGVAYWALGNRSEALKAVKELRRYDPARADILFNLMMGK